MNKLEYIKQGVIGDKVSLNKLSFAETANLILVSDTHGDYTSLIRIFNQYGKNSDAVLFSGDGLNDFLYIINEALSNKEFQTCLPPILFYVLGNSDIMRTPITLKKAGATFSYEEMTEVVLKFPENLFITICGIKILLTHGHNFFVEYNLYDLMNFAKKNECSIAVYGHTHFPLNEKIGNIRLINPGSTKSPRRGANKSFAILSLQKNGESELNFVGL